MSRLWKVRFRARKGEASFTYTDAEAAVRAAQTFKSYPGPDEVLLEPSEPVLHPAQSQQQAPSARLDEEGRAS